MKFKEQVVVCKKLYEEIKIANDKKCVKFRKWF